MISSIDLWTTEISESLDPDEGVLDYAPTAALDEDPALPDVVR